MDWLILYRIINSQVLILIGKTLRPICKGISAGYGKDQLKVFKYYFLVEPLSSMDINYQQEFL